MEKIISVSSPELIIWQIVSLIIQIAIVVLLYRGFKFLIKSFKTHKV